MELKSNRHSLIEYRVNPAFTSQFKKAWSCLVNALIRDGHLSSAQLFKVESTGFYSFVEWTESRDILEEPRYTVLMNDMMQWVNNEYRHPRMDLLDEMNRP